MTEPKKKSIKKVLADLAQQDPEKHNQRLAQGYGIGEPVVEVPVSQLAQWNDDLRALLPVGTYAILNELADLLQKGSDRHEGTTGSRCRCGALYDREHDQCTTQYGSEADRG